MKFSEKVKRIRSANNQTQSEFAGNIGASKGMVAQWEAGNNYPSVDILIKMRLVYNVSLDDLLLEERDIEVNGTLDQPMKVLAQEENRNVDYVKVDAQGIMSILEVIRDEQKELITSLKKIQAPSSLSGARHKDEPHTSDAELEVEKVRAKIASGQMGVRNASVKRKASEKK